MSPDTKSILNVTKLVKRFGGFYALDGLSFHVVPGEILGLVGPNGSGKTTAINVISGLYAPDGGEVVFDGTSIGGVASHRLVHGGINRTFQVPKPFLSLTVRQNIQVALSYGYAQVTPPTIDELLDEYRPDGIVCANDCTAGAMMHTLLDLGVSIPGDVRLVGIDDIEYARLLPVPLTTLRQPTREIGDAALAAMLERVARPDIAARDILLHCELIVRGSCGGQIPNP